MVLRLLDSQVSFLKNVLIKKCGLKVVVAFVFTGVVFLLQSSNNKEFTGFTIPSWVVRPPSVSCSPQKNIAFLKSHKCASSTIQNILFRYGLNHKLHFALPETGTYFGGGRMPFTSHFVKATPWYMLGLNIMAIHMKWNYEQVASIMPNDTQYITIVREPSEMFESLFTYTAMDKAYNTTFEQFVAEHDSDMKRYMKYLGYNQMTWDFGLPGEKLNDLEAVQNMIEKSDREFDLVMVSDRMEESLVLMSQLFCWDISDVLVLKLNARFNKYKKKMNTETAKLLKKRLAPDYLLYNHFTRKFNRLVEAYGKERMDKDVATLRRATARLNDVCGFEQKESMAIMGPNRPFSNQVAGYNAQSGNSKCNQFTRAENSFLDLLRSKQKMEAISKYGSKVPPGIGMLPLGADVVANPQDIKERIEMLKGMLVHKDPAPVDDPATSVASVTLQGSIEGNITNYDEPYPVFYEEDSS